MCQLFLSYNTADRESVMAVQKLLQARGISTFLDRDKLVPGLPWPQALEQALRDVDAVAVFIGRGLGGWQKREMSLALIRQEQEEKQGRAFPVIPVLLPGADDLTPAFLFVNTWIDLRAGIDGSLISEALELFERAVKGKERVAQPPSAVAICPYRGLQVFREEDAAFFAGRAAFSDELLDFTRSRDLVAVVGPSGSGKSSLVQAGLIPRLRRERQPAATWDAVIFTPGKDPFHQLASALILFLEPEKNEVERLRLTGDLAEDLAQRKTRLEAVIDRVIKKSNGTHRLLLVADQFEELFTLTPEPQRQPFAHALLRALGNAPFTLLVTLRADFYSQIITLDRELGRSLDSAQKNVVALDREELRESITAPARLVGLEFEPGLVERILADVGNEPGRLPLVEFALTELCQEHKGRLLTNEAYDRIGGVIGALAQRAENEFARLNYEEQTVARRLFSRLVRVAKPDEGGEDTRQRSELQVADTAAKHVATKFADARLLVTGGAEGRETLSVEVAHEALIRNWARLQLWLNEDREFLLWRQRLQVQAVEWQEHGLHPDYLLGGAPLSEAERWLGERRGDLGQTETILIEKSVHLREYKQVRQKRNERRFMLATITAAAVLFATALVASLEWANARQRTQIALAEQTAAQASLIVERPPFQVDLGALLAVESIRRHQSIAGYQALRGALSFLPRQLAFLSHDSHVVDVAFNPDGSRLLTITTDRDNHHLSVFEWDLTKGKVERRLLVEGEDGSLLYGLRNALIITRQLLSAREAEYRFRLIQYPSGRELFSLVATSNGYGWNGSRIDVPISVAANLLQMITGSRTRIDTGAPDSRDPNILFAVDGHSMVLTTKDSFFIQELRTLGGMTRIPKTDRSYENVVAATTLPLRPSSSVGARFRQSLPREGLRIAAVKFALPDLGEAVVIDERGRELIQVEHQGQAGGISLASDGKLLTTLSLDRSVRIWEIASGHEVARIPQESEVSRVVFDHQGSQIATVSGREVRVFHFGERPWSEIAQEGSIASVAFSPDGKQLATAASDISGEGGVQLSDVHTGTELFRFMPHCCADDVRFSHDGRYLGALVSDNDASDGELRIWELGGHRVLGRISGTRQASFSFTTNDAVIAKQNNKDETVELGTWISPLFNQRKDVRLLRGDLKALSTDGKAVATRADGFLRFWDSQSGQKLWEFKEASNAFMRFALSGKHAAIIKEGGTVEIREIRNGGLERVIDRDRLVTCAAFSPDERLIATGSEAGTARVWNIATGEEVAEMTHSGQVMVIAFSPDGRFVASADEGRNFEGTAARLGTVRIWPWNSVDLVEFACHHLTRNLTQSEWLQYFHDEGYHKTCANLPNDSR